MSAYLISADGYATFIIIFKAEFDPLDLSNLLYKYRERFIESESEKLDFTSNSKICNFLVAKMVNANSQNIIDLYGDRCSESEIILTTEQGREFVRSGTPNLRWLKSADINKQLIVKAISWWQYQTCDGEAAELPVYKLLDEAVSKYAVDLVKDMPGDSHIPESA